MQIVIDMPDGCYEELNSGRFPVQDAYRLEAWIKNGTPLPKGHGKIIDSKEVYKFARKKYPHMNSDDGMCRRAIATALRYTTAIIEADEVEE